ncbi:MAG TPA: beta-N-acetylglucosaminidase domain-containing protein, partial [Candidatus Agathobaculum pullicola]|nr:beta-N-acetylglucosaminidase domain-containing protein [Candidatus Agathobaculum pullicola]
MKRSEPTTGIRIRLLSMLLVCVMVLAMIPDAASAAEPTADEIEQAVQSKLLELYQDVWVEGDPTSSSPDQYQIYPVPQEISYPGGDAMTLPDAVKVAAPDTITQETKDYLNEVLGEHGHSAQFVAENDQTADLFLGLVGDGSAAASALSSVPSEHYNNTDAYALSVSGGKVSIVSKDSRGIYYGVATLNMMLSSLEGERLVPVLIKDYASIPLRGIVEGFYGGFTEEQRREQIRFCRDVKMNIFIYASKTDPYHHEEWEQLYPPEEIAYFEDLVQIGKESNVDFSWSVHTGTFFRSYNSSNSATQIQQLKDKFQQMIDIGVRQFAILNDDFGSGSTADVVYVVNEMNSWLTGQGFPPLIYCPQNYNNSWANGNGKREITGLTDLDDDIMLFWTGRDVNSPFWQDSINYVVDNTTDPDDPSSHQTPVFWVNYPCNEHAKSGLLLGSAKYYLKDDITGLGGAVSNPIFFAETSKVAYFQLANYFWNVHDVEANADYVWEQSFKYLQPEVYDAYFTIARNACEAPGSTRIAGQIDESAYIADALEQVKSAALNRTLLTDPTAYDHAITLLAELRHIQDAVETFQQDCKNEALKTELANPGSLGGESGEGWLHALDNMAKTAEALLLAELEMCKSNPSDDIIYRNFSIATAELSSYQARTYLFPHGNNVRPAVKAGTKRILPFVNALMSDVEARADQIIGTIEVEIPANRIYTNISSLSRMPLTIVGDEFSVRGLLDVTMQQGDYVGIKMDGIAEISQVDLEGTAIEGLTLQYSYHGDSWTDITAGTLDAPILARYLRLANLSSQPKTINLSRLAAVVENRKVEAKVSDTNITNLKENDWPQMLDGNESTYVWTGKNQAAGDYFTIDLGKALPLGEIQFITADGTPRIYYAEVSISTDNKAFTPIGTINDDGVIDPPYRKYTVNANQQVGRYIRLKNTGAATAYMKIHEVSIGYDDSGRTPSELISVPMGDGPEAVMDGNLSTVFRLDGTTETRMTIHVTDNTDVDSILLLTAGISNAAVSVEDVSGQIHSLGTAAQSLNRFSSLPANGIHTIYLDFPQGTPAVINELLLTYGSQVDDVGEAVDNIYLNEGESADSTEEVNLALKRSAEASGVEANTSYTADLAVDGNADTRWASQTNSGDRWILVDLGEDINLISSFNISYHAKVYPISYEIQMSNDKTNWVTVKTLNNQTGSSNITNTATLDKPVAARYVRLFFGGDGNMNPNAAVKGISIKELEVLGVRRTTSMIYMGVTQPEPVTVDVGAPVELPTLLDATISDGMNAAETEISVLPTWTPSTISTQQEGIIDATSPLPTGRFLYNTKKLSAQFTVVVGSGGLTNSNLALNQPADASGEELVSGQPQKASYAVDGSDASRWSSGIMRQGNAQATDQWLSVDLGTRPVLIKEMDVKFHLKVWPTEFYVEASNDNQNWVRIDTRTRAASNETDIVESFTFNTPISARYLRLYFPSGSLNPNSSTGATGVSVKEWIVTGDRFLNAITYTGISDTFEDKTVDNSATVKDLDLPPLLNVTWQTAEGVSEQVQVVGQWDTQGFDTLQNQTIALTVSPPTSSMYQNPQNLSASMNVTKGVPGDAPVVTTTTLGSGKVNEPYSESLSATGETPITWSISSGNLPAGLSL